VAAGRAWQPGLSSAPFDHCQHLQSVQPRLSQMALTIQAAEERSFAVVSHLGSSQVSIHVRLSVVMSRDFVPFSPFSRRRNHQRLPF
jgi:hypothetical protein